MLLLLCVLSRHLVPAGGQESCLAESRSCEPGLRERDHPWPSARGPVGSYGRSHHVAPRDLAASLAWTWHDPLYRYSTLLPGGLLIDRESNIYTVTLASIVKLSPAGVLLWAFEPYWAGGFSGAPVLVGDRLYGDSMLGYVFALDLETGDLRWKLQVSERAGGDSHSVGVQGGVLVTSTRGAPGSYGGNQIVVGVNISRGKILWQYSPEQQLLNFMPMFTESGTVVFQDQHGGVHNVRVADGQLVWRSGWKGSWSESVTFGMSLLGPNGVVYAVHVPFQIAYGGSDLRAYRLDSGEMLWQADFPYPINSQPVVARLGEGAGFSVVVPAGEQPSNPPRVQSRLLEPGGQSAAWLAACAASLAAVLQCCCSRGCCKPTCCRAILRAAVLFTVGISLPLLIFGAHVHQTEHVHRDYPSIIRAFDAQTGKQQWEHVFPTWKHEYSRGDAEGFIPRTYFNVQKPICGMSGWGSPSVDGAGTVHVGHYDGRIYVLRDADGDGAISGAEVSFFDMEGSATALGGAHAPGILAWASCDAVFVFKDRSPGHG